jgi:hypothetical protein
MRIRLGAHHRHHPPPRSHKLSVAVEECGQVVGVAIVGRPVVRHLGGGFTLEVTRCCTDGTLCGEPHKLPSVQTRRTSRVLPSSRRRHTGKDLAEAEAAANRHAATGTCLEEAAEPLDLGTIQQSRCQLLPDHRIEVWLRGDKEECYLVMDAEEACQWAKSMIQAVKESESHGP